VKATALRSRPAIGVWLSRRMKNQLAGSSNLFASSRLFEAGAIDDEIEKSIIVCMYRDVGVRTVCGLSQYEPGDLAGSCGIAKI